MKISSIDFLHSETAMKLLRVQPKLHMPQSQWRSHWGVKGGRVPPLTAKNCQKSGRRGRNSRKSGKKGKNREGSFTLPLLKDRAGYATAQSYCCHIIKRQICTVFISVTVEKYYKIFPSIYIVNLTTS